MIRSSESTATIPTGMCSTRLSERAFTLEREARADRYPRASKKGDDACDADEEKNRGSDDRVACVLIMGRLDKRHIEAYKDHVRCPRA